MSHVCFSVLLVLYVGMGVVQASGIEGVLDAPVLATGSGRVLQLSPQGDVIWEHKAANSHDAWKLPNGHVLFADGVVTEVTPAHEVVFRYEPDVTKGGGAFSCQRLSNGHTVIGENASGRVVEVDAAGKVVCAIQTHPVTIGAHDNLRMVRKLANGNYLVCHAGNHRVIEYRPDGSLAWSQQTDGVAFAAVRLANGNTLVTTLSHVTEYDPSGAKVWVFAATELPQLAIRNMTGLQVLPNGNLVIGCYAAYDQAGHGTGMFEITREKQLVWRYVSPGLRDRNMMGVHKVVAGDAPPMR